MAWARSDGEDARISGHMPAIRRISGEEKLRERRKSTVDLRSERGMERIGR